jgi:hypothetical protein
VRRASFFCGSAHAGSDAREGFSVTAPFASSIRNINLTSLPPPMRRLFLLLPLLSSLIAQVRKARFFPSLCSCFSSTTGLSCLLRDREGPDLGIAQGGQDLVLICRLAVAPKERRNKAIIVSWVTWWQVRSIKLLRIILK